MTAPLLRLTSITKSFGGVRALKGVSFELQPGEVHALLGENGAGKSTLIKIVTGAHQPDGGTIEIAGQRVEKLSPAAAHERGIVCIYQQPALFPQLTVAENIALRFETGAAKRVNWPQRNLRARELLQRIGAAISPEAEVGSLSMPEQQLVEIACALGSDAKIVIMDEPTASLTQKEQHLLFAVVRDMRAKGIGVIYISHRLEEIFSLADRVTVLRDGESIATRTLAPPASSAPGKEAAETIPVLTESELIKLMVGREVSHIFPPAEGKPGDVVLALRNVGCAASGVREVTLELRAGEILGLAGLVGAGRTELARILFGLTRADAGEILLNGRSVVIGSPREAVDLGIAYVPEDRRRHGVILDMPIAANMTMAVHRRIFPGGWLRPAAERTLALGSIRELNIKTSGPEAPGSSLSGGNQQKVSLARWLAAQPKVLILDEPTQGVDVGAKSEIHKIIRRLARDGMTVLMISSDLPEILGMSDRIAVMREGTIAAVLPGGTGAHEVMSAALGQATSRGFGC
jgi:rhamnose transport system ATP-binding protein